MTQREARRLINRLANKPDWIENALKVLETKVSTSQSSFAQELILEIINQLEVENGRILYSPNNKKLLARIDKIQASIRNRRFNTVINTMVTQLGQLIKKNADYYGSIVKDKKLVEVGVSKAKEIIANRLGINKDGTLVRAGYMQGLLDTPDVAHQLKDYAFQSVARKSGFESFKRGLKVLIEGEPDRLGIFERFYRNYAYDVYSHIDALQSKLLAEDFGLKYFIYNGGLIKTSRSFCIRKNGNIFSTEDVKSWSDEPDNTAKPPNYDPLIHRGGYGCRHSIDYISEEMAFALQPTLDKEINHRKEAIKERAGYLGSGMAHFMKIIDDLKTAKSKRSRDSLFNDLINYPGMKELYFNPLNNKKVYSMELKKILPHELVHAKLLTTQGFDIVFAPQGIFKRNEPKFDIYLISKTELFAADLKDNSTPTSNAITKSLESGDRQAKTVLINVNSTISKDLLIDGLIDGFSQTKNLTRVGIFYKKRFILLNRNAINKKYLSKRIK